MIHKLQVRSFIALIILLVCSASASADKKIFLLADIHVMSPQLLDNPENEAWQAYLSESRKMVDYSVPVFDKLCKQIIAEKPDLLLIAGDMTKDGEFESHDYVTNKLTEIEKSGIPVFVIPGNHDRGWQPDAKVYQNNTAKNTKFISKEQFLDYYKEFGYGNDSEIHSKTLTYAKEILPGLTLIGIDSDQTAKVDADAAKWAGQKAKEAKNKGQQVIAMMHHALLPHIYNQEALHINSVIKNYKNFRDQLMEAGVKVIFTGHYHISDITRYTSPQGQDIYDVCTGSPISYPCDYRILTFDNNFRKLKITTSSVKNIDIFPYFQDYARERLHNAVYAWAVKRVDLTDSSFMSQIVADIIADIFITHAEGNEHLSENAALASQIASFAPEETSKTIQSILGDYPSPEEKDNVVDDRELTITMPALPTAIRQLPTTPVADQPVWYTLQGVRLNSAPTLPGIYLKNGQKVIVSH